MNVECVNDRMKNKHAYLYKLFHIKISTNNISSRLLRNLPYGNALLIRSVFGQHQSSDDTKEVFFRQLQVALPSSFVISYDGIQRNFVGLWKTWENVSISFVSISNIQLHSLAIHSSSY